MSKKRLYLLPVSLLIVALSACNLPTSATPASGIGMSETAVAQTITAVALSPESGSMDTSGPATATFPPTSALPTSTYTPVPSATQVCDNAQFVSETVPDGTLEPAGAAFSKSWRLKNTGACTWNTSYALVFVSGNPLGAPASVPLGGNVAPGQEVDLIVNMQAPAAPGNYTSNWILRNAGGVLFGLGAGNGQFWAKITVPSPTPTVTLTPSAALPSLTQIVVQVTAGPSGVGHAVANCPSGSLISGGGFAGSTSLLVYSDSASGNGWEVDAQNLTDFNQPLNAYAECLLNSSGSSSQVVAQVYASASAAGHAVAMCPSGSIVTGGGFAANQSQAVFNTSVSANGWQVYAQNNSASSQLLNAYAVCLSGTSAATQQIVAQVSAAASATGHILAACPSGSLLTGGGYAGNQSLFVYSGFASGSSWEVDAQNTSGSSQLLNSYAICLSLP
jgi:hypothetical protein